MEIFQQLETALISFADKVPVELFVFLGSFVEEVIAPIPSPFIMTTAGSIIALQGKGIETILWLAPFGALGKLLGALVLYIVALKAENFLLSKFSRFIGISNNDIEYISRHFKGTWRDYFILILVRSLPLMPSAPVSVVAGLIKLPLRVFIVGTFVGTVVRDSIFMYFGFVGLDTFGAIVHGLDSAESALQIGIGVILGILIAGIYWKRRRKFK